MTDRGQVVSGYAVVEVETTGLCPGGHDRIVEIVTEHGFARLLDDLDARSTTL